MGNILDDEAEPDEEFCWRKDPHASHDWASAVLNGNEDDYVLFTCPGQQEGA
jgi:hypothetical protein